MKATTTEKETKITSAYPLSAARAKSATSNSRLYWLIGGLAVGASAMFLLDPVNGSSRRASLRQGANRFGGRVTSGISSLASNLRQVGSRVVQPVRGILSRSTAAPTEYLQ